VRILQRTHFDIISADMPATEITERLGVEPDRIGVRASRSVDPPRPPVHSWEILCDAPGLCVDEQIDRVIGRLEPIVDSIGSLVEELEAQDRGYANLQVARFFDYPEGEEDIGDYGVVEGGSGQHQLLGWHLDRRVLEFLRLSHAELDVDEYG
jgi:hypothetical protein